jgi:hypothetical protein
MTLVQGHEFPASVAPRLRSRVLGLGLMMLAGASALWAMRPHVHPHSYLLTLSSTMGDTPGAVYFSAWDSGPVVATHDVSDGKTVIYRRDFQWDDGCNWQAVETLTPVGDRYYYFYTEQFRGCPEGQEPTGMPTPRAGYVSVTSVDADREPTPLTGTLAYRAMVIDE